MEYLLYEGQVLMDTIQEVEMSGEKHSESERGASNGGEGDMTAFRPVPLEVLDHVQINIKPETPGSMLKGVLKSLKSDRSFTKRELKKAEQLMTQTFAEFYQKLRLLKSYWYHVISFYSCHSIGYDNDNCELSY